MRRTSEDPAGKESSHCAWTTEAEAWRRVKELLAQVLEMEPQEREAFLDEACAGEDGLRGEVERLVASAEEMGDFIEKPAISLRPDPPAEWAGRRIGRYEIRREIGRGGIGAVYLAVRADDTFEKEVAVKLLKRGMDTDEIVRRFRHERQILAQLEHPHIARLLDGGSTEDGLPYLVMEYVDGEPIDCYCDKRQLSVTRRLKLFLTVCTAVSRAHQSLVVHRDLKPGNILVNAEGEPKLLDFGIAKVLSADGASFTTRDGFRLMTPEYASPEHLLGQSVTTSTDVYSLGIVLYELLTGGRPYQLETRSAEGLARAIAHADASRPSVAVSQERKLRRPRQEAVLLTPQEVAAARRSDSERLRRRLAGDLDAIALKALAKEPEERYASVEQLAKDVENHLRGLPVFARPPTLAYRSRKFLRRHPAAVVTAAAVLLLTLVFGLVQWRQSRRLSAALTSARQEQVKAKTVAEFLGGLFDQANPDQVQGDSVTVRQMLDRGAARIREELQGQPSVQADLMDTMGRAYSGLGFYEDSRKLLEESLALRRVEFGGAHPSVAASLKNLANLNHKLGEYPQAEQHLQESLAMLHQLYEGDHPEIARTQHDLAQVLMAQGDLKAAEGLLRETLKMKRRLYGEDHPDVATGLNSLAELLWKRGEHAEAVSLFREALDIRIRFYGEEHLEVARALNNLAAVQEELGKLSDAEQLWRRALAIRRKILGDDHPDVATILGNLAILSEDRGDLDSALALQRETLEIRVRWLGEEHPNVALCRNNLANVLTLQRQYEEAEKFYRQALDDLTGKLGPGHLYVAFVQRNLAWNLSLRGDPSGAETLIREALAVFEQQLAAGHWRIADARSVLGGCLAGQGRLEEAEPLLREGLAALEAAEGPPRRYVAEARSRLSAFREGAAERPAG